MKLGEAIAETLKAAQAEGVALALTVAPAGTVQRWLGKFGQADKWKICLRAARMPRIRSDNGKASTPDARSGLQGEGGVGRHQGREDAGRAGAAVRRAPEPDHRLEGAADRRRCR